MAMIDSVAEIGNEMRRNCVKSKCVSSGTMRNDGSRPRALTTVSTAMKTPRPMRTYWVTDGLALDRHAFRPRPLHPPRHDQASHGEGGEDCGDDADAERHGKAAHRT